MTKLQLTDRMLDRLFDPFDNNITSDLDKLAKTTDHYAQHPTDQLIAIWLVEQITTCQNCHTKYRSPGSLMAELQSLHAKYTKPISLEDARAVPLEITRKPVHLMAQCCRRCL